MTDPTKLQAMNDWPVPTFIKSLRDFLGVIGYYKKFIKGCGDTAAPLTAPLKKNSFEWLTETQEAFEKLKVAVTQPPVLALPDFSKIFVIECDAFKYKDYGYFDA